MSVRFCPWYPLADAAQHAPAAEGVLQIRLAHGLVDYPRGKSAMVHYEHATDVRAAALAVAARASQALLGRHLIEIDRSGCAGPRSTAEGRCGDEIDNEDGVDHAASATIYAKVLGEFVRRFGTPPAMPR
jgi:hypothetical protein